MAGANGAGKSTLLRILAGLRAPDSGHISWDGADIRSSDAMRAHQIYVSHANAATEALLASENLAFACAAAGLEAAHDAIDAALDAAGLHDCIDMPVRHLSAGQRRRLALARLALAHSRPLWLLDEPFNALDHSGSDWLSACIDAHTARGGIVVLTSHLPLPLEARELRLGACA